MNKVRKTLVVVFSALFVLCMALFAVGCGDTNSSKTPDETKSAYSVSVDVNDPSLGKYTLTAANSGDAYVQGTAVTVTVEPNEDYDASLIVNGEEVALTDNAYTFTVEGNTDLQVNYNYIYVAYTNVIAGEGTVTLSEPKNGSVYEKGEEVTVTVEAAEHYELKSLRINNDYVDLTEGTAKFNITGRTYVFAEFVALHTVTVENEAAKGTVVLRANGKAVESGVELAEGTEVELTVTPLGGNTVKAVYVAGAWTPLNEAGKATFTLRENSTVEVIYNTYYTVTLPKEAEGGSIALSEKAAALGYLEGTELTLTVTPADGYVVTSFKVTVGGEEVGGAKLNFGKYTFTVTADVTIEVEFEAKEAALSYNVNVAYSNSGYGAATLSGDDANDDGTYSYGAALTLKVNPSSGYKVSYVTINGSKVAAEQDGTYAFTVTEDINIFVCFEKAARFTVRVEMYGLTGATVTLQIDGSTLTADAGNEYIKTEVYEGQTAAVAVKAPKLDEGLQLFYYLNDDARVLYVDGNIDIGKVTQNVTVRLTAEVPTEPTIKFATTVDGKAAEITPDYSNVETFALASGKYTLTLAEPKYDDYVFGSYTVKVGGKEVKADKNGAYVFDYDDKGMEVTVTADWKETVKVTLSETPTASNGTVSIGEGEGPYVKGSTLTINVKPNTGYRIKTVSVSANGTAILVTVEPKSGAQDFEVKADDNLTVAVEYVAIYTYEYKTLDHASFTIEKLGGTDFLEYAEETHVYTYDLESNYKITFKADAGYQLTEYTVNGVAAELQKDGSYLFNGKLTAEPTFKVVAKKLVKVTYSVKPERSIFNFEVSVGGKSVRSGEELVSGTLVYIHFDVPEGFKATLNGTIDGTTFSNSQFLNSFTSDNRPIGDDDLNFDVVFELLPVELTGIEFEEADPNNPNQTSPFPTQGEWTNDDDQVLVVKENTMCVNGDPVTEFKPNPANTDQFIITTNNAAGEVKTYTLEWFGGEKGFILELTNTTPAPAREGRRNAANDAAAPAESAASAVTYLVNPVYGTSWYMEYLGTDKDTLMGADGKDNTWVHKTETGENKIVFSTDEAGKVAHISFNGTDASYVFAVKEGRYLFVVGTTAYDLTISAGVIIVNDETYNHPNTSTITVSETGKVDGCSYTLKNGETDVASGNKITVEETTALTLTVTLKQDYTVSVVVTGADETHEGNVWTITNLGPAVSIAITYVAPEKKVIAVSGAHLDGALLILTVQTNGYFTADELKTAVKLVSGTNECPAIQAVAVQDTTDKFNLQFNGIVDWNVAAEGYILSLKVNDAALDLDLTTGATQGSANLVDRAKTFTLSVADGKLVLTVSAYVAPTEYTVTVTESGKPADQQDPWYTLAGLTEEGKVLATGTITLTITPQQNYTVESVEVTNGTKAQAENVYTITAITGNVTIAITYKAPATPPTPSTSLHDFDRAWLAGLGVNGIQVIFTYKATGYENEDAMKGDVKLIIGTMEGISPVTASPGVDGGLWTVYFQIGNASDIVAPDGKVQLKLQTAAQTYETFNFAGAIDSNAKIGAGDKNYSLSVEDNKLYLNVADKPTVATVTIVEQDKPAGDTSYYTLTQGENQAVASGSTVSKDATLTLTINNLPEGYEANVTVFGATLATQESPYTINGLQDNVTITITYVNTANKSLSDFGISGLAKFGTEGFRFILRFKANGYTSDKVQSDIKIDINGVKYSVHFVEGNASGYIVYFLVTTAEIANLQGGSYQIKVVADKEYTKISSGLGENNPDMEDGRTYTLVYADNELTLTITEPHTHTFEKGVCTDCHYVCAHTFGTTDGACSACGQVTGKQQSSENLGDTTNGWNENSKRIAMTKPADGKALEVVYTATFATDANPQDWFGVVTQFFDGAISQAFLQGNCFLFGAYVDPWGTKSNIDRTIAAYGTASKVGYFCRVTVLWIGTSINVTYQLWKAGDDLNKGADKTGSVTFSGLEKNTYGVSFGQDGVTSTDAKLVVNEYTAVDVPEAPKTKTTTSNVAKTSVPTLWDGYLLYQLHENETIVVTGQHDGGNRAFAGVNAFIFDRTATEQPGKDWLYIFRAAGDCAATGWDWNHEGAILDPGYTGTDEFITAKEHGQFEITVTMVNHQIRIIYKIWAQGTDMNSAAKFGLCAVFNNMNLGVYDIGFAIDKAAATDQDPTADGKGSITEAGLVVKQTTVEAE